MRMINEKITSYKKIRTEILTINDLIKIANKEKENEFWKMRMKRKIEILVEMIEEYETMDERRRIVFDILEKSLLLVKEEFVEKLNYKKEYKKFEEKYEEIKELSEINGYKIIK